MSGVGAAADPSCETKPICPALVGTGEGRQGYRRRWAKTCETKPIRAESEQGQVLCGKRIMTNWACKGPWQNKANSPRTNTGTGEDG